MHDLPAVESVFLAALEKGSPEERAAYLERACGPDLELRRCVERLLSAHPRVGDFLQAAPRLAATADQPSLVERPGSMIGPYKLMEQLGEGGMGLVFVAEQRHPVRRKVALKLIRPGMDSRDIIARFEAERQALALMDHPNIAKVLDAGATESGRPYFVMELVKGIPITDYCDQDQLPPRDRLELFVAVCQAVQHAHQKGIIHRDIKPSNVLVAPHDGTPVVKVIDFGIAKAIGQQLTEKSIYTRFAQMIGTPLYMSPEQAEINALDVDTRSDVYALGVLLYELLTGTTPFDRQRLQQAALDEVRRIIREEEPPRPSTRLSTLGEALSAVSAKRKTGPRELSALVRGDLDWVVMKALEKDRTRRYETPGAFAADVRRFLGDEPVEARPPSAWYRFRKLARRNRVTLVTAALVAMALVAGTAVSAWQAVRATRAEAVAAGKAHDADQARHQTERERDKVTEANGQLRRLADDLRRELYVSDLKLAEDAARRGETRKAREFLERHRPAAGERDLRGFEWHYLWRLCHSAELTLPHRASWVSYSPDGKLIASVDNGYTVKVWDATSGREVFAFHSPTTTHPQGAGGAFSPDGKLLALTGFDGKANRGEVKVLDATTGQEVATFKGHKEAVYDLAFSPDGRRIASAGADPKVRLWDPRSGDEVLALAGFSWGHTCVAFSPDGQRVAAGAETGGTVKVWDAATGQEVLNPRHLASITSVAFSPDGKVLASASSQGEVVMMQAATGAKLRAFRSQTGWVYRVAFSPDSKWLATGSGFGEDSVRIWEVASGEQVRVIRGQDGEVRGVAFSPDGRRLAAAADAVTIWDATADQEARTIFKGSWPVWRMAFHPDGSLLAVTGWGPAPRLWDTRRRTDAPAMRGPSGGAYSGADFGEVIDLAFSGNGQRLAGAIRLASGTRSKPGEDVIEVRVWDVSNRRQLRAFRGQTRWVSGLALSSDGRYVASVRATDVDRDSRAVVMVWDIGTGEQAMSRRLPARATGGLTFSPDGRWLASTDWSWHERRKQGQHEVKLWDLATGAPAFTLTGHTSDIYQVAFNRDGGLLASADWDGTTRVWEAGSGRSVVTLPSHARSHDPCRPAFSPDGRRLATASGIFNLPDLPGTIHLWDLTSGREALALSGHSAKVVSLAFSPDGHLLASADHGGVVKVWDGTPLPVGRAGESAGADKARDR